MTKKDDGFGVKDFVTFIRDWGAELAVAAHVLWGFVSKDPPPETAHDFVKIIHGGKHTIEDEIGYENIEANLPREEQFMMRSFRRWIMWRCGTDHAGKAAYKDFDNDFRVMVLRMRSSDGDITRCIRFLTCLSNQIRTGMLEEDFDWSNDHFNSENLPVVYMALERGYLQALRYLEDYNMPRGKLTAMQNTIRNITTVGQISKEKVQQAFSLAQENFRHQLPRVSGHIASTHKQLTDMTDYDERHAKRGFLGRLLK